MGTAAAAARPQTAKGFLFMLLFAASLVAIVLHTIAEREDTAAAHAEHGGSAPPAAALPARPGDPATLGGPGGRGGQGPPGGATGSAAPRARPNTRMEHADEPARMSLADARSGAQFDAWHSFQAELAREAERAALSSADAEGFNVDFLFLGDSITESLRGTSFGRPAARAAGCGAALREALGPGARALILGISGDMTQHLLWRMREGGELPAALKPRVVSILIGTNNLKRGYRPEEVASGIMEIARSVYHSKAKTAEAAPARILLHSIMARADPAANRLVRDTNLAVERAWRAEGDAFSAAVRFVDCRGLFDGAEGSRDAVDEGLMPDGLHPNAAGMKLWLETCVLPGAAAAAPQGPQDPPGPRSSPQAQDAGGAL